MEEWMMCLSLPPSSRRRGLRERGVLSLAASVDGPASSSAASVCPSAISSAAGRRLGRGTGGQAAGSRPLGTGALDFTAVRAGAAGGRGLDAAGEDRGSLPIGAGGARDPAPLEDILYGNM